MAHVLVFIAILISQQLYLIVEQRFGVYAALAAALTRPDPPPCPLVGALGDLRAGRAAQRPVAF